MSPLRIAVLGAVVLSLCGYASAEAACPPVPRSACRLAVKNQLRLTKGASDTSDRLKWSWKRGAATTQADFGNPTASTAYALCIWDATGGLLIGIDVPPGGTCGGKPCWRATKSGWGYDDRAGTAGGIQAATLTGSSKSATKVQWTGRGAALPDAALPLLPPLTVQLLRADGGPCFESVLTAASLARNDATQARARLNVTSATPMPPLPSTGCGTPPTTYTPGTTTSDSLMHAGIERTFRVHVPPGYDPTGNTPTPVVLQLHGGFGSGAQIEGSSRLIETADAQGFVLVSPDGVPGNANIRTWNGGGCCGYAAANQVDDVGFVAAMLDRFETSLCVDRRRVYATGMSNGGIMSHRLACDLADRIRAVASVAGAMMASPCAPARPVPVMAIHGTGDLNLPYTGGMGCGAAGVPFPSVAETIGGWTARNGCTSSTKTSFQMGDGTCVQQEKCSASSDVATCTIPDGGHQWPGGNPPAIAGLPGCPFGYQSQTFSADEALWGFFSQHPPR